MMTDLYAPSMADPKRMGRGEIVASVAAKEVDFLPEM